MQEGGVVDVDDPVAVNVGKRKLVVGEVDIFADKTLYESDVADVYFIIAVHVAAEFQGDKRDVVVVCVALGRGAVVAVDS